MNAGGERRDYRVVVCCAALAVVAVAAGVAAVVVDEPVFALVAAVVGVVAAGVGALLDVRRSRAESSMWEARAQARRLRREVDRLSAIASEERSIAAARAPGDLPASTDTDEWEIDPVSGLIRERHLPVVLQQVVASARRKVQPVSVIYWELDGFQQAPDPAVDDAITALGAVAWRTLRESDSVFRLGERAALGVLADTAEDGAVVVADRVRTSLRTSPVGDTLTVSAGIACYPTHALDAAELVSRAGRALDDSRAAGFTENHVAVAPDA
ncbi:MAG: GGDEF domain-containing protein [Acidimicrobiia bacterium]